MPGMPLTINCVHSPKILTKGYQLPYVILVNHRGISHDNPFGPILDSSNFEGPNSSCNGFFGEGIHIPDWGQTSFGTPRCAPNAKIIQKHHCLGGSAGLMVTRVRLRLEAIMVKL